MVAAACRKGLFVGPGCGTKCKQHEQGSSLGSPLALRPSTAQALALLWRRERDASSTHHKEAALRQRLRAIRYEMVMEMSQGGHPGAEQTSLCFALQQANSTQHTTRSYLPNLAERPTVTTSH